MPRALKAPLVAVEAARRAGVRLVVAGGGRMQRAVERAAGEGIDVLGEVDDAALRDCYQRCRALVFPGREDFEIVPVEAQACGTPVIALGAGGVLDSVVDGVTGVLYDGAATPSMRSPQHSGSFDPDRWLLMMIRRHAERFGQRGSGRKCASRSMRTCR